MTGLRFVAAGLVVLHHLHTNTPFTPFDRVGWLLRAGNVSVSFFFVLSGFVLTWSARPDTSPRVFYRRRFARIYPAYAASLLLALGADMFTGHSYGAAAAVAVILGVQSWVPVQDEVFGQAWAAREPSPPAAVRAGVRASNLKALTRH